MIEHLHENTIPILDRSDQERANYICQPRWIGYSRVRKLLLKMEDLMLHPETHRAPNLLIKAKTNNGKSFVLNHFEKLHPVTEDLVSEKIVMPVLKIEIPPAPKVDEIYSIILRKLRIPFRASLSKEDKADKAIEGMRAFGVKVLCIDEIQVLMNTTKLIQLQLLDTIKFISNQSRIPIVGAGTYEAHTAITSDSQLANRFDPFELPQWKPDQEFQRLLASYERQMPLRHPSELTKPMMANLIYGMSEGWIGEVFKIISQAAKIAIKSGEERITKEILESLDWISPEKRKEVY